MINTHTPKNDISTLYQENGYYFPLEVLEQEELTFFQKEFFRHESLLGDNLNADSFKQTHLHFPWAYKLVTHPKIVAYVKQILGENVLVHGSSVFCKNPKDKSFISWHQDGYYFKLKSYDYVSAWIALSDSTIESGCMRFIPKSHFSILSHKSEPNPNNLLGSGLTVDDVIAKNTAIDVELKAGEMSLHHVNLLHSSNPNTSSNKRIGFAVRYISSEFSQELEHHDVVLASGNYTKTHFNILKTEPSGSIEENIIKQKIAHDEYLKMRSVKINS